MAFGGNVVLRSQSGEYRLDAKVARRSERICQPGSAMVNLHETTRRKSLSGNNRHFI
jgi:hypothetical protein